MKLTDIEKKILLLAMDRGAAEGEVASAAGKLLLLLRKRYADGHALIRDLEVIPDRAIEGNGWRRRREIYGDVVLRFGKYRGQPLRDIPADYLIWVLENFEDLYSSTRTAIENYLDL